MCGRYTHKLTWKQIHKLYTGTATPEDMPDSFNFDAAPGSRNPIVRGSADGGREALPLLWGVPVPWSPRPIFNAKAETLTEKKTFREAVERRRCIVPAEGFYEWLKLPDGKKQRHLFRRRGGEPFAFAGIVSTGHDLKTGDPVEAYIIVTTTPNELVAKVHDRMPVMLDRDEAIRWLDDPATPLRSFPAEEMEMVNLEPSKGRTAAEDQGLFS
jgi:putative SOS response-associated peptidase YedK